MSINVGTGTADLSGGNLGFHDMRVMSLAGAGTAASVLLNDVSGSGNAMALTMTGLEHGVSAFNVSIQVVTLPLMPGTMTGTLDIATLEIAGAGNIAITGGTQATSLPE